MNYTLHQLQIFLKIAQTKSVTKAAEELHLTQPAVSIQLKNLQQQFDIPLTEVVGRKIFITDFGQEIAVAAENILNEVYAINYKTLAYKGQLTGRLKISVVSTGKYVIPFFLSSFMKLHPGVEFVIDVTNKSKVVESLDKNEVDFSLVSILPETLNVHKTDLIENKLYLVGNRDIHLKKGTTLKQLTESYPLIFRENGSGTRQVMEKFLSQHQLSSTKKLELTSNEAVKQAVLAGMGISVMPIIGIKSELQTGEIKILPVKGLPIQTVWRLIWLTGKHLSPAAAALLDYIKKEKTNIINQHFS